MWALNSAHFKKISSWIKLFLISIILLFSYFIIQIIYSKNKKNSISYKIICLHSLTLLYFMMSERESKIFSHLKLLHLSYSFFSTLEQILQLIIIRKFFHYILFPIRISFLELRNGSLGRRTQPFRSASKIGW